MCLVTRQIKPITTKKDLVVFKDVKKGFDGIISHFFIFLWEKGILNTTELSITKQRPYNSSFSSKHGYYNNNPFFDRKAHAFYAKDTRKYTVIREGFHAAINKRRLVNYQYDRVKFLIPKGSLIFKDATGLIVSNQMMLL